MLSEYQIVAREARQETQGIVEVARVIFYLIAEVNIYLSAEFFAQSRDRRDVFRLIFGSHAVP